jgi:Co/Zn/Cd efflux system component
MAIHVGALSIAAFAYYIARQHAGNPRFTFGTGKVATLGGYTSAVALGLVALLMATDSVVRLIEGDADTRIADLHIWRVGPRSRACILSLVTHAPKQVAFYKETLAQVPDLDHVTVEIHHCTPDLCPAIYEGR